MPSSYNREKLLSYAKNSIKKGSKSFAFASQIFDPSTRENVILFYAWCRRCDDIIDNQDHGFASDDIQSIAKTKSRKNARKHIYDIKNMTELAFKGHETGDIAFDALGLVLQNSSIEKRYINDIIKGFALDAEEWRPRSEHDLYQYCYHVAGAVGIITALIMGISVEDEETLDRASDLGIAFQLANIARDIGDDASNDRCYIPIEWLVEMDIEPGQHMRPHYRSSLTQLASRLCFASQHYTASALTGVAKLPFRSRWTIITAADIYGGIADKVLSAGEAAWNHRQYVSKYDKFTHFFRACFKARKQPAMVSSDTLWTRPKS